MKITIILLMIIGILNGANIEVQQNMKALYQDVKLTDTQKDYIFNNQDNNIEIIQKVLKKDIEKFKSKYIDEKNIISFILAPDGKVINTKLLKKSNDRNIDRMVIKSIDEISKKFAKPQEPTELRFIISYRAGQNQQNMVYTNNIESISSNNEEPYYQSISRGTTKFQYDSKEYIRFFETNKDGFIDVSQEPISCAKRITILTEKGQSFAEASGYVFSRINKEAPKGKYKILIQTKQNCNINLQYQ